MKSKLQQYQGKILNENKLVDQKIPILKKQLTESILKQIEQNFRLHMSLFEKHRKTFNHQLQEIEYYLVNQKPKHKCKINSLLQKIDQKFQYNLNYFSDFETVIVYPLGKETLKLQQIRGKMLIYQNCFDALKKIIYASPNLVKYCKKQTDDMQKYLTKCRSLIADFKINQWKIEKQIVIKGNVEEVCNSLAQGNQSESLKISVKSDKGIITNKDYQKIMNALYHKKNYLKDLKLHLMDMQFYQQKCDIIKRRLIKFPVLELESVKISNYYSQCKLGNFWDFNWHPYRKKVNINVQKLF